MATLVTVDLNSKPAIDFDAWVNLGTHDPAVHEPVISGLDRMQTAMAGFDQPVPQTPALGSYAYPQPDEFARRMDAFKFDSRSYWGGGATPARTGAADMGTTVVTSALDVVGSLFEAPAPRKMEIAEPAAPAAVETGGLSAAMNGLSRADRYKQETVAQIQRKPGHDFS